MKRKALLFVLVIGLCVGTASAQLGSGIVYDPTNYQNALLRYQQLQQHLLQLQKSYAKITDEARNQYTLIYASHIPVYDDRYRNIDVRVDRPDMVVTAPPGYYPSAQGSK